MSVKKAVKKRDAKPKVVEVLPRVKKQPPPVAPNANCPVSGIVGKFAVIESNRNGMTFSIEDVRVHGVFDTFADALAFVKDDAEDVYDASGGGGGNLEKWGSDCLVVEVKSVVRPVPEIEVKMTVKTVAGEASERVRRARKS